MTSLSCLMKFKTVISCYIYVTTFHIGSLASAALLSSNVRTHYTMEHSSPDLDASTHSSGGGQPPTQHTPEQGPASEHDSLRSTHSVSNVDEGSLRSARPYNNIEEEKKNKTTNKRSSCFLFWETEFWTWFCSVCCFIAIIVVLAILNNNESPNWYFEITPNARHPAARDLFPSALDGVGEC